MSNKFKTILFLVLIVALALYYISNTYNVSILDIFKQQTSIVEIGDATIHIDVADTREERIQGLSGRTSLDPIQGLLFVFDETDYHGIWMKDMLFPIDIIWISEDFHVVDITTNVTPDTYPQVFEPSLPVRYILETGLYYSESFGIEIGDEVVIPSRFHSPQQ